VSVRECCMFLQSVDIICRGVATHVTTPSTTMSTPGSFYVMFYVLCLCSTLIRDPRSNIAVTEGQSQHKCLCHVCLYVCPVLCVLFMSHVCPTLYFQMICISIFVLSVDEEIMHPYTIAGDIHVVHFYIELYLFTKCVLFDNG
jgi:hypothetical protein